jgi:hypothetical protein
MKAHRIVIPALIAVFVLSLIIVPAESGPAQAQDAKKADQKQPEKIRIPKVVKDVITQGLPTRQGRQDIPLTVFNNYFFPTPVRENMIMIFFFRAKNADLGYAPAPVPPAAPAAAPAKDQAAPAPAPAAPAAPAPLQAQLHVFMEFHKLENGAAGPVALEVYVPATLTEDPATYDPEKADWYSVWSILPGGEYVLALALASPDLKRIGVGYYDVKVPRISDFDNALGATPIFIVKNMEQVQQAASHSEVHKGFFPYSVLNIVPNLDGVTSPGQTIEIFYFLFGAKLKDPANPQSYDLEANYEVRQAEKSLLKWPAQTYQYPLISQPLPLVQTLKITDPAKGERMETKSLDPGTYELVIQVLDKVSGNKVEQKIPLVVK